MQFSHAITDKLRLRLSTDKTKIVVCSRKSTSSVEADYSFGIEEEYFLVDQHTLDVSHSTPDDFFSAVNWATGGQAMREMLQAQLEVVTNIHVDIKDAREELNFLRQEAARVASQFGLAIMASGTHPTASWRESRLSPKGRYERMIKNLCIVGERNMLCGMHVHVQLPDPARRFRVMRAMIPYIPLFIAMGTSSPYWNGRATGLKGYRLAAYDELPRTGMPELFHDETEYRSYVDALVCSGSIPDESHVWWAMRPSSRHPTLELRASDSCTRVEDAIAITSLYRALVRHLDRQSDGAPQVTTVDRAIAVDNKWRAQRYGMDCNFSSIEGPIPVSYLVRELVELVRADVDVFKSENEAEYCNTLALNGTSADHQLRVGGNETNLDKVKEWIARTTTDVSVKIAA